MIKCKFCGAELSDDTRFCSSCGAKTEEVPVYDGIVSNDSSNDNSTSTTATSKTRRPLNVGILAWSIVNTVLGGVGCCTCLPIVSTVLGIIAIIYTIMAQDSADEKKAKSKIRTATILNIIATVITIISVILFFVLIVIGSYTSVPYSNFNIDEFMRMYPSYD